MSPLPSTGMVVTVALSSAMVDQSATPEYSCSAVRAWTATAAAPASSAMRPATSQVRCCVVEADPHLHRDRDVAGAVDRGGHHGAEQPRPHRQRRPATVAGDLAGRAAEVEVDVVDADLVADPSDGLAHHRRVGAVELDRADGFVVARSGRCRRCARCPRPRPAPPTISLTYSAAPNWRHRARNAPLVTPAMGARTTGGSARSGPICRGGMATRESADDVPDPPESCRSVRRVASAAISSGDRLAESAAVILVDATGLTAVRPDRALFEDLSVTIASGDRLAVVGVNGTGKSTLLGAIAGSRDPEAGTVRRGNGARDQPPRPGRAAARRAPSPSVTGDRWEAAAVRDRLGLAGLDDRPTDQLSGGQIKRVALARALLTCGPPGGGPPDTDDLLILDEPTNHLDVGRHRLARGVAGRLPGRAGAGHPRPPRARPGHAPASSSSTGARTTSTTAATPAYLEAKAERAERAATAESKRRNLAKTELAWLRRGAPARTSKPKARIESATADRRGRSEGRRASATATSASTSARPASATGSSRRTGLGADVDGRTLFDGLDLLLDPRERLGIVGPERRGQDHAAAHPRRRARARAGHDRGRPDRPPRHVQPDARPSSTRRSGCATSSPAARRRCRGRTRR